MSYVEWLEQSVADAGLHWLSPEVQAVLRVQMMARDRFVDAVKAAIRAADITTADEYALALLGEERNLQRVPGEDVETWRNYIMNAPQTWQDAGTLGNLKRQLERLNIGNIGIYEWGNSDPTRWAEFSVYIFADDPVTVNKWGTDQDWGDDGVWGWDGDPNVTRSLISLIRKWKPAKSKLRTLVFSTGPIWGVEDGLWDNDGLWNEQPEIYTLTF